MAWIMDSRQSQCVIIAIILFLLFCLCLFVSIPLCLFLFLSVYLSVSLSRLTSLLVINRTSVTRSNLSLCAWLLGYLLNYLLTCQKRPMAVNLQLMRPALVILPHDCGLWLNKIGNSLHLNHQASQFQQPILLLRLLLSNKSISNLSCNPSWSFFYPASTSQMAQPRQKQSN